MNDRFRLWDSCIKARGFEQGFLVWVAQFGFSTPVALPDVSWMLGVLSVLEAQTQALARRTASDKSGHFMGVLEDSWAAGGSLPFRLMRESQAPEVLELQMKVTVKLAPQKWLPCGKAWLKLLNAEDFRPGDELVGDCCLQVVAVQAPYISVSQAISRRTAASLSKSWIEADPSVWSQHVFDQWNVFWQRDAETAMPPGSQAYVDMVPQVPSAPLVPLDFPLWTRVLKSSKPTSMRGVDGWSFAELRLVPQGFVEVLLQLFHWCERTCSWPRVFQTWLVVLLRKVPTGIVSWGSVRPISVAATLYRMWSKMRTTQLMAHARTLATSTVRPCLATRSIWGMQVEIIAEYLANSITPCGLVLDLIKAFNVVCRPFLKALMLRLGFQPTIVDAWFSCLEGLSRQALVAGAVYGTSKATTGIPEGDPISVVGMFALCCLFREVVSSHDPTGFPFSYADNWEVVTGDVSKLVCMLRALDDMSRICLLPVAPSKCWTWAFDSGVRKQLSSCTLSGQAVPVRLTGCCLGADMAYSYRKAAATRNDRVASGHRRLLRLRGIPTSRFRKCRLILGGVFPHALHACEASWLPPTLLARLRSKVVKSLKLDGSGVNPFLACSVAAPKTVDPEWAALSSRIRLFRSLWKDFPEYRSMLIARLVEPGRRYRTPTDHLVRVLRGWGWECVEGATFQDAVGRRSLVTSSLSHVMALLSWHWGSVIRDAVQHRKGLEQIGVVHVEGSRPSRGLLPSERGLLSQLVSGRHFTKDARSHFVELVPLAMNSVRIASRYVTVGNTVSLTVPPLLGCVPTTQRSFVGPHGLRCCMGCGLFPMGSLSGKPLWTQLLGHVRSETNGPPRNVFSRMVLASFLRYRTFGLRLLRLLLLLLLGHLPWFGRLCCQHRTRRFKGRRFWLALLPLVLQDTRWLFLTPCILSKLPAVCNMLTSLAVFLSYPQTMLMSGSTSWTACKAVRVQNTCGLKLTVMFQACKVWNK